MHATGKRDTTFLKIAAHAFRSRVRGYDGSPLLMVLRLDSHTVKGRRERLHLEEAGNGTVEKGKGFK
jgi:hypothetical protein